RARRRDDLERTRRAMTRSCPASMPKPVPVPLLVLVLVLLPSVASAQTPAIARGVPLGQGSSTPLALTLADAIKRGLTQNLAVILEEQHLHSAESDRLLALSQLLPRVSGSVRQSGQVLSTA